MAGMHVYAYLLNSHVCRCVKLGEKVTGPVTKVHGWFEELHNMIVHLRTRPCEGQTLTPSLQSLRRITRHNLKYPDCFYSYKTDKQMSQKSFRCY